VAALVATFSYASQITCAIIILNRFNVLRQRLWCQFG